jgi:hypothetical protein
VTLADEAERERAQRLKWRRLAAKRDAWAEELGSSIDAVRLKSTWQARIANALK